MKKAFLFILICAMALSLAACGSGTDAVPAVKAPAPTGVGTSAGADPDAVSAEQTEAREFKESDLDNIEIDITEMNSTMVYSQVYDMMVSPDDYLGKTVKMTGTFNVSEGTDRYYFACVIQDATACCAQGIEFVLDGDYEYPADYPPVGTDITVVGVFDSYYEGQSRYVQLIHAKMS